MTGPVATAFTAASTSRPIRHERRGPHLRLPAERLRKRGHARPRAGAGRHHHRQHLRGHGRGRAPGAPGDPPRRTANIPRRASSSPAAPRRSLRTPGPRCPGSTACWATSRSCGPKAGRPAPARRVVRHHGGARDGGASGHRVRRARARLRAGAAGLRPSLHLLRHPVRPRPEPQRAGRRRSSSRCARWWPAAISEVVLTGVDIASYGADLPGAPTLGPDGAPAAGAGAGACRACGCPRSTRRRSMPICGG